MNRYRRDRAYYFGEFSQFIHFATLRRYSFISKHFGAFRSSYIQLMQDITRQTDSTTYRPKPLTVPIISKLLGLIWGDMRTRLRLFLLAFGSQSPLSSSSSSTKLVGFMEEALPHSSQCGS